MIIGSDTLNRNGESIKIDVPAKIVGDRVMVPARAVAECFGAKVDWDGKTQMGIFTSMPSSFSEYHLADSGLSASFQPLIFNNTKWSEGVFYKNYDFVYYLTNEQFDAVFPNINYVNSAMAHYLTDGALVEVNAQGLVRLSERKLADNRMFGFEGTPLISSVHGIPVTVFFSGNYSQGGYFQADFKLGDVFYRVELTHDMEYGKILMTQFVNELILGEQTDLSVLANPVIPKLRRDTMTLEEARLDPDFGAYIPTLIPDGFVFHSARRIIDVGLDELSLEWEQYNSENGCIDGYINLDILNAPDSQQFVSSTPVFLAKDLSLDIVKANARLVNGEDGTKPGWFVLLFIQYENIRVEIRASGASPEQIWAMLGK